MGLPNTADGFAGAELTLSELVNPQTECWHYVITFSDGSTYEDYYLGTEQYSYMLSNFLSDDEIADATSIDPPA